MSKTFSLLIATLSLGCAETRRDFVRLPAQVVAVADLPLPSDRAPSGIDQTPPTKPHFHADAAYRVETLASVGTEDTNAERRPQTPISDGVIQVALHLATDEGADPEATGIRPLRLDDVIGSVYRSYPALQAALYSRNVAAGEQLAATGEFDLKLSASSENGPMGYYQTYRQNVGLIQPIYSGGRAFGGYRIGRGDYQPWYLERQTNDGGEFRAGIEVPLARNHDIDSRRAGLWRAGWGRQLVEPEIQAQLISFVQEGGYAYWEWVAAGEKYRLAERVLAYATDRTARIRDQVNEGLIDPPELTDNLRLVAQRRAILVDAGRKLEQSAIKLSLYWRDADGNRAVPDSEWLPGFPEPLAVDRDRISLDAQEALANRPELQVFDLVRRQLEVDLGAAQNDRRPNLDATVWGSQDMGAPTSPKRNKSPFELEAALLFEVPVQRRKARGKLTAVQGKLAQLSSKRRLAADKIVADVESVYAGLVAAYQRIVETREAVRLANEMADRERLNQQEGLSDLLKVTLREQYAAEAAMKEIDALLQYFRARADYRAALGYDRVGATTITMPAMAVPLIPPAEVAPESN